MTLVNMAKTAALIAIAAMAALLVLVVAAGVVRVALRPEPPASAHTCATTIKEAAPSRPLCGSEMDGWNDKIRAAR